MARNLTVVQEDQATTTPLLTGFLALAVLVLVLSALAATAERAPAAAPPLSGVNSAIR